MDYKLLDRTAWDRVKPIFEEFGSSLPLHPDTKIAVAEEYHVVVGLHAVQPQLHMEPVWIHPAYRGKVNHLRMYDELLTSLPKGCPFYAFVPNRTIGLMAGQMRMKKLPWEVWRGAA